MITRRVVAFSMPIFFFPGLASAQTVLLSARQRQAILDAKALAGIEAARYTEFAPLFARCAQSYASDNPPLARALTAVAIAFTAASTALHAGARAVPENLPTMPVLSARDLAPATRVLPGVARTTPPVEAPPQIERTAPLPPVVARQMPNLAPNVTSGILIISPEPIQLTASEIRSQTAASAEAWARIATGLREVATQTGNVLAPASAQFETASRRLNDAALAMLRARFADTARERESADRLGNFEIQDLLATANQSQTLASSVRKQLTDTASGIIRNIGG